MSITDAKDQESWPDKLNRKLDEDLAHRICIAELRKMSKEELDRLWHKLGLRSTMKLSVSATKFAVDAIIKLNEGEG